MFFVFFFSSRRRHTRSKRDWSSDVCSSDLSLRKDSTILHANGIRSSTVVVTAGSSLLRRSIPVRSRLIGTVRRWPSMRDRKSVVQGKSVDLGGRGMSKKKKNDREETEESWQ